MTRLAILEPGSRLEQGGAYVDLDRFADGPFQAIGGYEARAGQRIIAKRDTDDELRHRLVRQDSEPAIERPE